MTSSIKRPSIDDLKITTMAFLIYSNAKVDLQKLFNSITPYPIDESTLSKSKKKQEIIKSTVHAPKGKIIAARLWDRFKGLNLKSKRYWCARSCQTTKVDDNNNESRVLTMHEVVIPKDDYFELEAMCESCHIQYKIEDIKEAITFRNQLQLDISMGSYNVNVMMFENCYKIVGGRSEDDMRYVVDTLMNACHHDPSIIWSSDPNLSYVEFEHRTTMINAKFNLGVDIDRRALANVLNRKKYRDTKMIDYAIIESTGNPHVKTHIKGRDWAYSEQDYKDRPEQGGDYIYTRYTRDHNGRYTLFSTGHRPYFKYITNKQSRAGVSLITFASSQTIISGKHIGDFKLAIDNFCDIIECHIDEITEVISDKTMPLILDHSIMA